MEQMLQDFKEHLLCENMSKESVRKVIGHVRDFLRMVNDPSCLTSEMVNEYLNSRQVTQSTRNQVIWSLRNFFCYQGRDDISLPREKHATNKVIRPITEEEFDVILDWVYSLYRRRRNRDEKVLRVTTILRFMYRLGLTVKEFLELRREDFQIRGNQLVVIITANGSTREFLMTANSSQQLDDYYYFFGLKDTNAFDLNVRKIRRLFEKLRSLNVLEGKELSPRSLRYSFACNCLQKGMSIENISHLLGQDIKTT